MNVTLSLFAGAGAQFFDNVGNILAGGKIYTYEAGTTTPRATYTTASDSAFHTNPIILDSAGRIPNGGELWLQIGVGYKFIVKTSDETLIASYNNIPSSAQPPAANDADSIMYEQGTLVTAGNFEAGKMYRIESIGSTNFVSIGAVANISGLHFTASAAGTGTGTAYFSQTVETKLRQNISPQDFNAVGDGVTDDTIALTKFFTAIAGDDSATGDIGDDLTYLFSQLIIPNNVTIRGKSVFRADSSLSGTDVAITVQGSFNADTFHVTTAGTETNTNLILFEGDDVTIQNLIVESDVEYGGTGGVVCYGSNYQINNFKSVYIPRPIQFQKSTSGLGAQENIRLGTVDIYSYIRGIGMTNCNNWTIEYANMRVADSRATKTPGHNGILIASCQDFTIGEMYIADSGEHAFRIGGNTYGSDTARFSVNSITTRKTGGCSVKIAPVPDICYDGSFGVITAIDTGVGTTTANNEPIRFTNANNIYVGSLVALSNEFSNSCHRAVLLNACTNITIDSVHAENVSGRVINIDETYDSGTGNFSGLYVNACFATMVSSPRNAFEIFYSSSSRTIGDVYIHNVNVSGYANYLYENDTALTLTGIIFISGMVSNASVDSVTPITVDITSKTTGERYVGSSVNADIKAPVTIGSDAAFDSGVTPTTPAALFLNAGSTSTAGAGTIGASIAFSRAGSSRRGSAIVTKQFGADAWDVGLSFMPSDSASTANERVTEKMYLKPTGTLLLSALSTYANNGAAVAGGLVVGDLYKTSTGEVRIVV
jgi:hypothetical protein